MRLLATIISNSGRPFSQHSVFEALDHTYIYIYIERDNKSLVFRSYFLFKDNMVPIINNTLHGQNTFFLVLWSPINGSPYEKRIDDRPLRTKVDRGTYHDCFLLSHWIISYIPWKNSIIYIYISIYMPYILIYSI